MAEEEGRPKGGGSFCREVSNTISLLPSPKERVGNSILGLPVIQSFNTMTPNKLK